jgi:arsenate reductase-like glutaredoxin family protein
VIPSEPMPTQIFFFTQPGCISCDIVRIFLEAKQIIFEERDMSLESTSRELLEKYHSHTAPTVVVLTASSAEVIEGFDPDRLDHLLPAA